MTPRAIHALIFDLDGVIADTVQAHEDGWALVASELGITLSAAQRSGFRGRRRHDILRSITGRDLTDAEFTALMRIKNGHYSQFLESISARHILPGVAALLADADSRGLKLGVASSSYNAKEVLRRLDLTHRFEAIADGLTVTRPKPHADIFVWTAGALRVSPAACGVFEDAEAGVAAARDAGMLVVGVGDVALVGGAHHVVKDLREIQLDQIIG